MKISDHATYTINNNTKECKPSLFTCKLDEGSHVTANSPQNTTTILSNFNQRALNIANNFQQRLFDRFKAQRDFDNDSSCFYVLNYESCDQFEAQQFQNKLLRCFEKYKGVTVSADSIKDYWVETVREVLFFYKNVVNFFNHNLKKIEIGYIGKENAIHNSFIQEKNQEDNYYLLWNIHNDIMVFVATNLEFKNQLGFEFDTKIENVRENIYNILDNEIFSMVKNRNVEEISCSLYNALQNATDLVDQTEKNNYILNAEVEKNITINEDTMMVSNTESDLNYLSTIDVENYLSSNSQAFNLENYEINNIIGETQNSTDETNLISNMSFSTFIIVAALLAGSLIGLILVVFIIKLSKRIRRKQKNFIYKQTDSLFTSNELVDI
ncbi:hypothetical protein NBO_2g0046 [Nosema bombycis CQ1]|uniref:Uncharacterized protein n=1 Tax=Nosema bombycis (strain CQ1 / CVCC 102059) TaxID=578461 RepID=R0MC57_NOSB1|nr:hypothetical protein NBO_2g0046 [Nosema bombycis CQ1]|eukprot:EOB15554.1 hypothetical protein NBO_2g0046 [Nosema bombycis CQ1]